MTDSDFLQYNRGSDEILSTLETAQDTYYDLLIEGSLRPSDDKPELAPELVGILRSLSDTQKNSC